MKAVRQESMRKSIMSKEMRKWFAVLFFLTVFLSGCGQKKEEQVELTMIHGWGSTEADHVAMRQIYKDFEKEHPEIHLNLISMPSSADVVSKMSDLLTIGQIPDIVFTAGDGRESIYDFMVEKGYAVDLMPYIREDERFRENISPSILNYWKTGKDELYTVSDVLLMGGYWYNRSLFSEAGIEEPPKDWAEFEEACKKLKELGKHWAPKLDPMILDTDHIVYLTNAILSEEDSTVLGNIAKGRLNVQSASFRKTLDQLKMIAQYADVVNTYSFRDSLASFNKGETAIYINGIWANSMIEPKLDVAYAPFPSNDRKGVSMISSCVGYILGNTGDEKKIQASVEFLKYMLSEPVAERILEETGQIPSNPNIIITDSIDNQRLKQAVDSIYSAGNVTEIPANLWDFKLEEAYGENVLLYFQDKLTVDELQKKISEVK